MDDIDRAALADVEFHRQIAACTKNELYVVLLDSIGPALLNIRREALAVGAAAETRQPTGLGIACGCVLTGALPSVTVASG